LLLIRAWIIAAFAILILVLTFVCHDSALGMPTDLDRQARLLKDFANATVEIVGCSAAGKS